MDNSSSHQATQQENLHSNALDSLMASFADHEGDLTLYERATQFRDAPWGDGEIEPEEDDGWGWDAEYQHEAYEAAIDAYFESELLAIEAEPQREESNVIVLYRAPIQVPYIKKPIPAKLRWAVFRRDGYRCVQCGCDEDLTADHIVAELRGGKATIGNLQTLCRSCNSRKGAR